MHVCYAQALAANMRELQQAVQQQQEELQQATNRCDQNNLAQPQRGTAQLSTAQQQRHCQSAASCLQWSGAGVGLVACITHMCFISHLQMQLAGCTLVLL